MKKIGSIFLVFALLSSLLVTGAAAQSEISAQATMSKVSINDMSVEFEAYNIEGSNYFKLRDLAFALGGTDKGFEVLWDDAKNSISLVPETAYTPVGGELAGRETDKISITKTASAIYCGDQKLDLSAYNINGNNYFKLRDVLAVFDISVSWDGRANTIYIDSYAQKEVTVSNVDEFVRAIDSNTIIRMEPGVYDLTMFSIGHLGFTIRNITGLTIIGAGIDETELINTNRFKEVLVFENCRNIEISGVKAGHSPQEYECDAGVFYFQNCLNVAVDSCYLYGCGSVGVNIRLSSDVRISDTTITDCSLYAVNVYNSSSVVFNNCEIVENRGYISTIAVHATNDHFVDVTFNNCEISRNYIRDSLVYTMELWETSKISMVFNDCLISDNVKSDKFGENSYLFKTSSDNITLNRCVIKNNDATYGYTVPLTFVDCEIEGNTFDVY